MKHLKDHKHMYYKNHVNKSNMLVSLNTQQKNTSEQAKFPNFTQDCSYNQLLLFLIVLQLWVGYYDYRLSGIEIYCNYQFKWIFQYYVLRLFDIFKKAKIICTLITKTTV